MPDPRSWDVFCRVVDNYGDVGVCWRLARELAARPGVRVRMWIDDLGSLRMLVPGVATEAAEQNLEGIEVHRWTSEFPEVAAAEVCVEGFGCGIPERYVQSMAARTPATLWIVLEYLSAEPWVREHHALASPHPRWPLRRFFFFPGFEAGTGGVLREPGLLARREAHDGEARRAYWRSVGFEPPPPQATVVSMFAYPYAPLAALLEHWAHSAAPWIVAVPTGRLAASAASFFGLDQADAGTCAVRGQLELRVLPFVPQARYDAGLWSSDCVFVRGEDTFVRAQWAQLPFVWHIYPQEEQAHWRKLEAFLDLYCRGLAPDAALSMREFWRAWNQADPSPVPVGAAWRRYWQHRAALQAHARAWARRLSAIGELAENLAELCRDKLK